MDELQEVMHLLRKGTGKLDEYDRQLDRDSLMDVETTRDMLLVFLCSHARLILRALELMQQTESKDSQPTC